MAWNGSGSIVWPYDWTDERDKGGAAAIISASKFDEQWLDAASAIEATLNVNGENAIAADIAWGSNKITGLASGTAAADSITMRQVADSSVVYGGTTGGSSNAFTVTDAVMSTSPTAGMRLLCLANHSNTGAATLNLNSSGATAIVAADGATALAGGEIVSGDFFEVAHDGTSWVLIHSPLSQEGVFVDGAVAIGVDDTTPGLLSIYGGGTGELGGSLRLYNNADDDGTVDYWDIRANDGNGNFDIAGVGMTSQIVLETGGGVLLSLGTGIVTVGDDDSVPGVLTLHGGGTGEQGGEVRLYNNADDDGTVNWWGIEAEDGTGELAFTKAGTPVFGIDAAASITGVPAQMNVPGGRLTATTGDPNGSTSVAAGTVVYYSPSTHNTISLYNGSRWVLHEFSELTNTFSDSTDNPAATATSSLYDMFVWNDGGTLKLGRGPAWTNDTTRSMAISRTVDGIFTNDAAITNGPAQYQGRYVGTIYTNASNQLNYDPLVSGSVTATCNLWNMYNRQTLNLHGDGAGIGSHTYSTGSFRAYGNDSNLGFSVVCGLSQRAAPTARLVASHLFSGGVRAAWGWGYNSTTASFAVQQYSIQTPPGSPTATGLGVNGTIVVGMRAAAQGRQKITPLEFAFGGSTFAGFPADSGWSMVWEF